jgi:hypothetical protein
MRHTVLPTLALAALAGTAAATQVQSLNFLGQDTFPTGFCVLGTNMGGLSGIAYNPAAGNYYAVAADAFTKSRRVIPVPVECLSIPPLYHDHTRPDASIV